MAGSSYRIQLADQYYLELLINDQPVMVGISSVEVYITQSVYTKLPCLKLIIRNEPTGRIINFFEAGDAAKITIEMGRDLPNNPRTIRSTFRQFGAPKFEPSPGGYTVTILGLLDAMQYLNQRVPQSFEDTTTKILATIAAQTNLNVFRWNGEPAVDSSSDKQVWRPSTMKYPEFVQKLADCAYDGDTSCFVTGIDEERTLYFKNIAKAVKQPPQATFVQSASQGVQGRLYGITEYRIRSKAGTLNNWIGYSYNQARHNLDGTYKEETNLNVVRGSNFMEINKEVSGQLAGGKSRYEYRPIDCGNTYTDIEKARYQNKRIRATFSSVVDVLTEMMTQEDLLSVVGFEAYDATTREINAMYKGNYVVMAKTRCIVGSRYYEKFHLESQGRNEDKFGFMV